MYLYTYIKIYIRKLNRLVIVDDCIIRKKLDRLFNKFEFNLDIQTNLEIRFYRLVQCLRVSF